MQQTKKLLSISSFAGRLSAIFFFIAALSIVDALQTLMRHDFNQIDIVVGETIFVTGSMPSGKENISDVKVHFEGIDNFNFKVTEVFTGFWFGGMMWRATLNVPSQALASSNNLSLNSSSPASTNPASTNPASTNPDNSNLNSADLASANLKGQSPTSPSPARPNLASLIIEDIWEETDRSGQDTSRQNPLLVYPIRVWENDAALLAADHSFLLRYLRLPPFILALTTVACALGCALLQWLLFRRADGILLERGFLFVHGTLKKDDGFRAIFTPNAGNNLKLQSELMLFDSKLRQQASGVLVELSPISGTVLFNTKSVAPRYGWFLQSVNNKKF